MTGGGADRRPLFTTCDVAATNYVRNPSCFLANVDGLESYIAGNNSIYHKILRVPFSLISFKPDSRSF